MSSQGVQQVQIGSRIDTNIDLATSQKHLLIRYISLWAVYETHQDADLRSLKNTFSSNVLSVFLRPDVSGHSSR